eukprot:7381629-Alexandrium_andersonii.AAC.1
MIARVRLLGALPEVAARWLCDCRRRCATLGRSQRSRGRRSGTHFVLKAVHGPPAACLGTDFVSL